MLRCQWSVWAVALWLATLVCAGPALAQQNDGPAAEGSPLAVETAPRPVSSVLPVAPTIVVTPAPVAGGLPLWAGAALLTLGAALAVGAGMGSTLYLRRREEEQKQKIIGQVLATELETRLLAYESVPLPTGAEAGVSFVSSVTALADISCGFRSVQGLMYLLPDKLAAHVSVHYAAVQRVADFVKGQSIAAAARMLQGNRLGGHPCPDAGTMREAHVELGAAFRGLDKLVVALRGLAD